MVMFLGSIIGGIVQCGQIFLSAAALYTDSVPDWLNWRDGSVLMVFTTIFIFPVSPFPFKPCMCVMLLEISGFSGKQQKNESFYVE